MPENQQLYLQFRDTISTLQRKEADLKRDIDLVNQQLEAMEKELINVSTSITLHKGGMSSIEVLTQNGYAIEKYEGEDPLALNPNQAPPQQVQVHQAQTQPAPPQNPNYQQQPAQGYTPKPVITPQAQAQFAPPTQQIVGESMDRSTPPPAQGPQIVQGPPPPSME